MDQRLVFDDKLIRRYDTAGPRYTSYPTAVQFNEGFGTEAYAAAAIESNRRNGPLSLYFHLPFCDTVCYYCACNKVVTKDRGKAAPYLERLHREIEMQAELFDTSRPVLQLHWGGGTPTFIDHEQMRALMAKTGEHFQLLDDDRGEYSIEIDPREASAETVAVLREIGFNRMSLGVQDFDRDVQCAVNRIQSEARTREVMDAARATGFRSISVDLIYGLPKQTVATFDATLDKVIDMQPDRLSIFNYAHLPERFKPQRRINELELPSAATKLEILHHTSSKLTSAGYVYIGMDHFALPDDGLAAAQRKGKLHRNFQGYATHADCDLIGLGITAIGSIADNFSQNVKDLESYYQRIDAGQLPVWRGYTLNEDDKIRRTVITQLICHFELDIPRIEDELELDFAGYFSESLHLLKAMEEDGLVTVTPKRIRVEAAGRLLVRNICMAFDAYLHGAPEKRYSRVI